MAVGKNREEDGVPGGHPTPILCWKLSVAAVQWVFNLPTKPGAVKAK